MLRIKKSIVAYATERQHTLIYTNTTQRKETQLKNIYIILY